MNKQIKIMCLENGMSAKDVERYTNIARYTEYYFNEEEEKEIDKCLLFEGGYDYE